MCCATQIGKGVVRRSGKDVCLLAYGSSVNEALAAAEMLEKDGISATVIDARFCKPLDTKLIRSVRTWQGKGQDAGDPDDDETQQPAQQV